MGYSTDFDGKFKINKQLSKNVAEVIEKLSNTRRMLNSASLTLAN